MADNVTITPGTGATIAADDVGGSLYQRIKPAVGVDGVAADVYRLNPMPVYPGVNPVPDYYIDIPLQVHVAAAKTIHWDLFNADASLVVRVLTIRQIPGIVTTVSGVATTWTLNRTTAVGTGGTALTPWLPDTNETALDADITARSKPTGGATEETLLRSYTIHSEESNAGTIIIASMGGLELLPQPLLAAQGSQGLVLRQNQGLSVSQTVSSAAGWTGWLIGFTVE
jgi:hypothetical protein